MSRGGFGRFDLEAGLIVFLPATNNDEVIILLCLEIGDKKVVGAMESR